MEGAMGDERDSIDKSEASEYEVADDTGVGLEEDGSDEDEDGNEDDEEEGEDDGSIIP